ncbi:MAG: LysR substrate-binding domain-containing protein, partial [Gammaproteobacteria bacterium]|nr:LysR substrate-binding domain-containing protein [Gammaproteobacteria bacterium]
IALACRTSFGVLEDWRKGMLDVAIVEEPAGRSGRHRNAECLHVDRLVWVGAKHGDAVNRRPLPVSLCNSSNALRPAMVRALKENRIKYRTVSELGTIETVSATVKTDLAISALLKSTVPADVEILGGANHLPDLPHFEVVMLGAKTGTDQVIQAFAQTIRDAFSSLNRSG